MFAKTIGTRSGSLLTPNIEQQATEPHQLNQSCGRAIDSPADLSDACMYPLVSGGHPMDSTRGPIAMSQFIGTLSFINPERGFGFITHDSGRNTYVFNPDPSLKLGDEVQFDIVQGMDGEQADAVSKLERKMPGLPGIPLAA